MTVIPLPRKCFWWTARTQFSHHELLAYSTIVLDPFLSVWFIIDSALMMRTANLTLTEGYIAVAEVGH